MREDESVREREEERESTRVREGREGVCVRERERGGREDERECARGSVRERRGGRMRERVSA